MTIENVNQNFKDNKWSWFICMSCFFGNFLLGGIKRSFGLALPILKSYFDTNTTALSWVASILEGMYYVVGPLASVIANKIGLGLTNVTGSILTGIGLCISTFVPNVYLMMATYSIMCGLGLGFIYLPASVACNYYFEKRIGLATGISKIGYSIGGIVFPLLSHLIISTAGWKAMFYMFACAALSNCGFGAVVNSISLSNRQALYKEIESDNATNYNQDIEENEQRNGKNEGSENTEIHKAGKSSSIRNKVTLFNGIKNKVIGVFAKVLNLDITMILFLSSRFFIHFGGSLPYIFLPTLMLKKKLSLSQGAYVLSAAACSNTLSRFTVCTIIDHPRSPSAMMITVIGCILSGLIMTIMPFSNSFSVFMAAGMLYGLLSAPEASLLSVVLIEISTLEKLNNLFGMVAFVQGIGTITGPPVAGLLIDQFSNDYGITVCYVSGGMFLVLAGVFCYLIKLVPITKKNVSEE